MRELVRWLKTALLTVARELYPGKIPSLRPFPKALLVIGAGLVLPFVLPVDARPAALTEELAAKRLERFLKERTSERPASLPAGEILASRPCFHWPAVPGATHYDFRLWWDGGEIRQSRLAVPRYLMRKPGRLESGRAYRYTATAYAADDRPMGSAVSGSFSVREPGVEMQDLESDVRLDLEPHDAALVLAGYFAERGSVSDVAAGLEAYLESAPRGGAAPLAYQILQRLGCR